MNSTRVFILASQTLFAEGVQSLLSEQPSIEVVGIASYNPNHGGGPDPKVFKQIQAAKPDVVIVEATGGGDKNKLVAQVLEYALSAKVISLTLEDNRIYTYYQEMKQGRSVEDLVDAIRAPAEWDSRRVQELRLFVLYQGHYGQRILDNVRRYAPRSWKVEAWRPPSALPQVVDDPQEFLPLHLPTVDLILSLGESPSAAQLLPGIVERTGAQNVIAPIDNTDWLPDGLARQLSAQLTMKDIVTAFPKPFCSLTEDSYNVREQVVSFDSPWIAEFARHFGRPTFRIECTNGTIAKAQVKRDTACGCGRDVARQLIGLDVKDAAIQAGLFQHHYPCLATMRVDPILGEPLIQVSGNLMRQAVEMEIAACLPETDERQTV
ncbi:MAG: hypothetical protein JW918_12555 [Anaerolineae bacterium]|nr:hypothetical protein [Anaerolineae bacterium]